MISPSTSTTMQFEIDTDGQKTSAAGKYPEVEELAQQAFKYLGSNEKALSLMLSNMHKLYALLEPDRAALSSKPTLDDIKNFYQSGHHLEICELLYG